MSSSGRMETAVPAKRVQAVCDAVLEGMKRGEWKPYDKLPSVRSMAERLKVHRLTVMKAYRRLKDDGIVEVKYKSGYFICARTAGRRIAPMPMSLGITKQRRCIPTAADWRTTIVWRSITKCRRR